MVISKNTKISELIKANEKAVDAIASINKHFEKLRNPILRKILASRVTIADAAKIGNSNVDAFFQKLLPLGFTIETKEVVESPKEKTDDILWKHMNANVAAEIDVRPLIESNVDPFNEINKKLATLQFNQVLKIINSFEPIPLIKILSKKGYVCEVRNVDNYTITLIEKTNFVKEVGKNTASGEDQDFENTINIYRNKMINVDVRSMEMPQPMICILEECNKLPEGKALFVKHKRIPHFLFPELAALDLQWKLKVIDDDNVHIIIFRND